jgi:hypothetical protein
VTVRVGELVCLARPDEVAACRALLEEISRSPDREPGIRICMSAGCD